MKKIQVCFLLLAFAALSFTACHNHTTDENDTIDPVVTISSPSSGASISGAVGIAGLATDENLHEMSIKVTKDSDGSVLFSTAPHVHDLATFTIAETWTPVGISAETAVTLTVETEDHNENNVTSTVHFSVKP